MRIRLVAVLAIAIACCCGGCYMGRYYPPDIEQIPRRDPRADFDRLRELFAEHEGQLVSPVDATVRWRDTWLFRVYEFKHHSVLVMPHNWGRERVWVMLFAGHVDDYTNVWDDDLDMHLDATPPALREVGLASHRLGATRDVTMARIRAQVVAVRHSKDAQAAELERIGWFMTNTAVSTWFRCGKDAEIALQERDGGLAALSYGLGRSVALGDFALHGWTTPVIAEGEFEISPSPLAPGLHKADGRRGHPPGGCLSSCQ